MLNAVASALTACLIYLLVLLLFDDGVAAWAGALLFVSMPEQIMWSATASVEPTSSMACVLALLAAAQYRRRGTAWRCVPRRSRSRGRSSSGRSHCSSCRQPR
ncbi:MAG: hypothetical protein QM736_28510 [Vicinamibacterales bacterium]